MSWSNIRIQTDALMTAIGYKKAVETFSVEQMPSTMSNDTYCLVASGLQPNADIEFTHSMMYPVITFNVNVIFALGNNSQTKYDLAMADVEEIVQTILAPANRAAEVRIVRFGGSKISTIDEGGFWLIAENTFNSEYSLSYNTILVTEGEYLITE